MVLKVLGRVEKTVGKSLSVGGSGKERDLCWLALFMHWRANRDNSKHEVVFVISTDAERNQWTRLGVRGASSLSPMPAPRNRKRLQGR